MNRILRALLVAGLFVALLGAPAGAAGWGIYAGGRLVLHGQKVLFVYPRGRTSGARELRLPDPRVQILNFGWDNVSLVVNGQRGTREVRYVYLTPTRWHREGP